MFGSHMLSFLVILFSACHYIQASKNLKEGVSCYDVYVDECIPDTCGHSEELNQPTQELCQILCVLNELCASWTYDQTSKTCDLIFCDLSQWVPSTCNIIGMPSGFDLNSCLQTNEGCEAFKQGACTIEEKYQIQHKTDTDKVSCQHICEEDDECAYFISSYSSFCDLYSRRPYVDCDQIIGPEEPEYEECLSVGGFLIAGGEVDGGQDELTEVIELRQLVIKAKSTPSFGQLPSKRYGAVGAMFGNSPILCGGTHKSGSSYFDSCISFQNSQWTQSHSMNEKRSFPAGVQINSTTFWILGGFDGAVLDSTEFIIQGQTNGVPGPKLPYALRIMCAVKLSEKEIFVIGGLGGGYRNEVWIYNPLNGFARNQGPSLNTPRDSHSCSIMNDGDKIFIVVVGGWNGHHLDSVEIYDSTDNTWHPGPALPYLLQYSAMAESPDGKGVLLFGGSSNGNYENRILELRAGANSWNFLDITLENGRYKHSVIPLQ